MVNLLFLQIGGGSRYLGCHKWELLYSSNSTSTLSFNEYTFNS